MRTHSRASARLGRGRVHLSGRKGGTAVLVALALTACGVSAAEERTVTVFAAASLAEAFTAEGEAFERAHPGTRVRFSFAGSPSLVAQVRQGAPADVLATADVDTIRGLVAHQVLAHNQLAVVTAPGSAVRTLADLARPGVTVVLAAPEVPAGRAARAALATAGVTVHPVSLEDSVNGVVTKVRLGEADAGLAYVTDVGDGVVGTPVPGATTELAIGALEAAGNEFVSFVTGPQGQEILRRHGFT